MLGVAVVVAAAAAAVVVVDVVLPRKTASEGLSVYFHPYVFNWSSGQALPVPYRQILKLKPAL